MSKYLIYALLNGLGPWIKAIHESVDASSKVETEQERRPEGEHQRADATSALLATRYPIVCTITI